MERLVINPPKEIEAKYKEVLECLRFVDDSRQEKPDIKILDSYKNYLKKHNPWDLDNRLSVADFVVRLLAKSESGFSTFEIFDIVYVGSGGNISREGVLRVLWDLKDDGVLESQPNRAIKLASKAREELLR